MNNTTSLLALLFVHGDPIARSEIQTLLNISESELDHAIEQAELLIEPMPFMIMTSKDGVSLTTKSEFGPLLQSIKKALASHPLTKSALETLTLLVYLGEATKAKIDSVRSVNSSLSLRNLIIRGLVEKSVREGQTFYRPTVETFQHLGITKPEQLPHYDEFITTFTELENQATDQDS
jgi:segregation and condensation protein B